ncbi:hypothetical protein GYMLUDRAFT_71266 [Collybiopsis luxurians FD-317 M1]|nr:hypothetical protein GYMLUDRAFT_71266 [Collybiopsis luxurians FD-317 M1]
MVFIAQLLIGICVAVRGVEVLAVPQTITSSAATVVTLYEVIPSGRPSFNTSGARPIDGTFEVTATVVGVSSGAGGSETTYSFGQYVSDNFVFTTTSTDSQGQAVTETVSTPDFVQYSNCERGQWLCPTAESGRLFPHTLPATFLTEKAWSSKDYMPAVLSTTLTRVPLVRKYNSIRLLSVQLPLARRL